MSDPNEAQPPRDREDPASREFAIDAARLARSLHCTDVVVLDVRGKSPVTDFVVIGTGTSDRQMRSVLEDIIDLDKQRGSPFARTDKDERALWLLADFHDVVVHLFEPNTRDHYDLELMWGDAPLVDFSLEGEPPTTGRDRAGLNR